MAFLTPTQLRELCEQYGLSPSKVYGQNYLVQARPIEKMIQVADLKLTDTVVEIGPGFGILTEALAEKVHRVLAFEIERTLEPYWLVKQKELPNVDIVWGNALSKFPISNFQFPKNYKVVANIPYQITSNLIRVLLESDHKPERIVLMVQKEVAERVCAKPGNMSLLSVSVQYYGIPKLVAVVTKGNFWPSPKVDSAILFITAIHDEPEADFFFRVVKAAFASKRKQLWKQVSVELQVAGEVVKGLLADICGNEKARAEELSMEEWRRFVGLLGGWITSNK